MKDTRAAIRYAKAILDIAVDNKATDAVESDMRAVVSTISNSKELKDLLASPIIKGEAKKKALSNIFKGSHSITQGLIKLLVDNPALCFSPGCNCSAVPAVFSASLFFPLRESYPLNE